MYQLSDKQPPSIICFILNSKNFVMVLALINKYFLMPLGSIWESATPFCMDRTKKEIDDKKKDQDN